MYLDINSPPLCTVDYDVGREHRINQLVLACAIIQTLQVGPYSVASKLLGRAQARQIVH